MFSARYAKQTVILALWIVMVMALFRYIDDRRTASVVAGAGFVIWPLFFLIAERRRDGSPLHMAVLILFLAASALPILLLRLMNWDASFESLSLLGIPAPALHRASNFLYLLLLLSALGHWLKEVRRRRNDKG